MSSGAQESRALRQEEQDLILFLLSKAQGEKPGLLPAALVTDMQDGGMGSILFLSDDLRRFGRELISAQYRDSDGTLVSIALNLDEQGDLFELDFWKVDFSSLKRYPRPQEVGGLRVTQV
jgi:hypothetical protein